MFTPDATCRPFLAFVALAAAACAALALVVMAYRATARRPDATSAPEASQVEPVIAQQPPRRPAVQPSGVREPRLGGGLRPA
jgi:hypothetical protein